MSKNFELLERLAEIGATVEPAGDRLVLRAGSTPIPAHLVASIRLAKPELLTALTGARCPSHRHRPSLSAAEWRARYREALRFWGGFHSAEEAAAIAWSEMLNRWHKHFGERVRFGICGGCRRSTEGSAVLRMGDGTSVHIATLDCLIAYGELWRKVSSQALVALGLTPPAAETSSGYGKVR